MYDALSRALVDLGFRVTQADPGVFYAQVNQHILILVVHVDDCIFTGSSPNLIAKYKKKFHERYALTDLGPVSWLLGIKVTRDWAMRTISLSQTSYIDSILARFSLADANSRDDSPKGPTETAQMKKVPYREAIGSLMYAAVATRPDIAFAMSTLSQFLESPGDAHWQAVKRVFRYLAGTKDVALTYGGERHNLMGYTDKVTSSCFLELQEMAPPSIRNACPEMARLCSCVAPSASV